MSLCDTRRSERIIRPSSLYAIVGLAVLLLATAGCNKGSQPTPASSSSTANPSNGQNGAASSTTTPSSANRQSATQAAPPQPVEKPKKPLSEMSAFEVAQNPAEYGFKKTATMDDGVMSGNDVYNGDLSMVIGRNEQWQLKKKDGTVLVLTVHMENGKPAKARWGGF